MKHRAAISQCRWDYAVPGKQAGILEPPPVMMAQITEWVLHIAASSMLDGLDHRIAGLEDATPKLEQMRRGLRSMQELLGRVEGEVRSLNLGQTFRFDLPKNTFLFPWFLEVTRKDEWGYSIRVAQAEDGYFEGEKALTSTVGRVRRIVDVTTNRIRDRIEDAEAMAQKFLEALGRPEEPPNPRVLQRMKDLRGLLLEHTDKAESFGRKVQKFFPFDLRGWKYLPPNSPLAKNLNRPGGHSGITVVANFGMPPGMLGEWDDRRWVLSISLLGTSNQHTRKGIEEQLDSIANIVRHEAQHVAQTLLDELKGMSEKAGLPSARLREERYLSTGLPKYPGLGEGPRFQVLEHSLRDVEFYTDLTDAVTRFVRKHHADPWGDFKAFVGVDAESYADRFFATLKGHNKPKWQKAVKEFAKAVESMGIKLRPPAGESRLAARVAARYKSKKTVKTKDGEDMVVYEYSDRQVQNRNREKAKRVEKLRKSLGDLQKQVKKDLGAEDEQTRMIALAVGLMNDTYERVGNEDSAEDGHYGVTVWQKKHVTLGKGKATFKYVGKSGVKQEKETKDADLIRVLKEALEGKGDNDSIFDAVDAPKVNAYLKEFDITAKDLRGLHANRLVQERLEAVRKGKLPEDKKEREKQLKDEFKQALEEAAEAVGHKPSTLRSQYLVPGLEENFLKDGTVKKNLAKQGTKTPAEKEDEQAEDMVKPMPKKKPPRYDLHDNRLHDDDDEGDNETDGADKDEDMSLNYKKVAARWFNRFGARLPGPKGAKPKDYWQTPKGNWKVKLLGEGGKEYVTGAPDEETAKAYAEGRAAPAKEDKGKPKPGGKPEELPMARPEDVGDVAPGKEKPKDKGKDKKPGEKKPEKKPGKPEELPMARPEDVEDVATTDARAEAEAQAKVKKFENDTKALSEAGAVDEASLDKFNSPAEEEVAKASEDLKAALGKLKMSDEVVSSVSREFSYELREAKDLSSKSIGKMIKAIEDSLKYSLPESDNSPEAKTKRETLVKEIRGAARKAMENVRDSFEATRKPVVEAYLNEMASIHADLKDPETAPEAMAELSKSFGDTFEGKGPDEIGALLAKKMLAVKEVANPTRLGGKNLSDKALPPEATSARARESYTHYKSLSPQLRKEAFRQAISSLGKLKEGDPKRMELTRVRDGLRLAAIVEGDELPESEPKVTEEFKKLTKILNKNGKVADLLDGPEKIHSPEGRMVVQKAFKDMKDDEVVEVLGGSEGLHRATIASLKKLEGKEGYEDQVAYLKDYLRRAGVNLLTIKTELSSVASQLAKKQNKPPLDPEVEKKLWEEFASKKRDSLDKAMKDYMDNCGGAEDGSMDADKCREARKTVEVADAVGTLKTYEDVFGVKIPDNEPIKAQIRRVMETNDPAELDALYVREGESSQSQAQKEFEAYKKEYPGTEKTVADFMYGKAASRGMAQKIAQTFMAKGTTFPKLGKKFQSFVYTPRYISEGQSALPCLSGKETRRRLAKMKMTKKGALQVTGTLDRIAELFQKEAAALGIPPHIAKDFAYRCDLLSDHVEKQAGMARRAENFNPDVIGEEVSGPMEGDADESYMKGEFSQQENRELRERQESGDLGASANLDPQAPQAGKQASFSDLGRHESANRLGNASTRIHTAAIGTAKANSVLSKRLTRLASALMAVQVGVLSGKVEAPKVASILKAVSHILPHIANVSTTTTPKVAKMVDLTLRLAAEEEEEPKEEPKEPPKEEPKEDEGEKKEAAHGFKLDA